MEADSARADRDAVLYRHAMIGASTLWQVEAAVRLVYQSEDLWRFLVDGGFVRPCDPLSDSWEILYMEALVSAGARDSGVSGSDQVVLEIAASLVGQCDIKLRHALPALGERSAKLVAEAIM
ncbi:MAG TPA: hypothetical protein VGX23_28135 [Actinocrinis sp.]|nr:hypothetical protein [Actinocrinis sp.]